MKRDELKRILLIMGAKDPALKMSVRQIMNRMESNEDLSSVFASITLSGTDSHQKQSSYVTQLIEDVTSGYLQGWKGREVDVAFLKDRYGVQSSEIIPILDAYAGEGAKVVWERDVEFNTPIAPEELTELLKRKASRLKPSYTFKAWSKPRLQRVYVKVFARGSKTYIDAGYYQSYEGKPWGYNRQSMLNDDFQLLASAVQEHELMSTHTRRIKHVYETRNRGFRPPLNMNWFEQQKYLSRNSSARMAGDIPKTVKRYVEEHLEQGMDESKAYAVAWSRYCQYKNPGSPRCKKDNYFEGKKSASELIWTAHDFDPWEFAKTVGIHPDSTKEFYAAIEDQGDVVAVLFTGYSADCFSFDIAVDPAHQKRGHGSILMDLALEEYEDLLEPFPDLQFCLDAINPVAVRMLQQRGFEITDQRGGHTYMTKKASLESRVAAEWMRRAYHLTLPTRTRDELFKQVATLVKMGLSPVPKQAPQRVLNTTAELVRSSIKDLTGGAGPSISHEGVDGFVRTLLQEVEVNVPGNLLAQIAASYTQAMPVTDRLRGRVDSLLESMAQGLSDDVARGAERGQQQIIRLLMRELGIEEWEAFDMLSHLVDEIQVQVPLSTDQLDLILTSYLD